jgi:sulfite reductase (NADPH) hemoprotein beta-component
MIRTRLPGGVIAPRQWLKLDAIATGYANGTLRLTTRQAFQFHGVIKRELKATIQALNAALVDTISACGDVNRNVLVSTNPFESCAHAMVHEVAQRLSEHLMPKTRAYYEIWLDEQQVAGSGEENEPVYGPTYLPRKFKIAFAVPPVNDVDVFANDIGFIAILENGALAGFNVVAGGGLGATHGDAKTYPRLADLLGFVSVDQVIGAAEAIVTTQRDFGDRTERKHARLKYTIDDRGLDWFKGEVERRAGFVFAPARAFTFEHNGDRFGWTEGEDGRHHLTLRIESGRIADHPGAPHLKGLREIARVHRGEFRLTPNQNLVIANIGRTERAQIEALVATHGLDLYRTASPVRLHALACVALPTCSQQWPRPNATFRNFCTKWNRCSIEPACVTRRSACASRAARMAARVRIWAKSRWSARLLAATTSCSAPTRAVQRLNAPASRKHRRSRGSRSTRTVVRTLRGRARER